MVEEVNKISLELKDIFEKIDRVSDSFSYEVWVPSLDRNIMFKEINTGQQKSLIKSLIDSPVFGTEFIFALRAIIKENCVEDIDTDSLDILDKLFIAMKMRSVSIGDEVEIDVPIPGQENEDEDEELKTIKKKIKLSKIIAQGKKILKLPGRTSFSDSENRFTIICNIPSIGLEYNIESNLRRNNEEINIDSIQSIRNIINDTFETEICKFIETFAIKENDEITEINLIDLDFNSRLKMVEKIPAGILENILNYINNVKEIIKEITLCEITINNEKQKVGVTIDGSFFSSSS